LAKREDHRKEGKGNVEDLVLNYNESVAEETGRSKNIGSRKERWLRRVQGRGIDSKGRIPPTTKEC